MPCDLICVLILKTQSQFVTRDQYIVEGNISFRWEKSPVSFARCQDDRWSVSMFSKNRRHGLLYFHFSLNRLVWNQFNFSLKYAQLFKITAIYIYIYIRAKIMACKSHEWRVMIKELHPRMEFLRQIPTFGRDSQQHCTVISHSSLTAKIVRKDSFNLEKDKIIFLFQEVGTWQLKNKQDRIPTNVLLRNTVSIVPIAE